MRPLLAAALLLTAGAAQAQTDDAAQTVVHAGRLLAVPGEGGPAAEQSIIIEDGRVTEIRDGYVTPDGAEIVDLSAYYVLPGLIDSHVHLTGELGPNDRLETVESSDADFAMMAAIYGQRTLEAGFTAVQDVGASGQDAIYALRDASARGEIAAPRIRAAGWTVSPTGGHADGRQGWAEGVAHALHKDSVCNGPYDCRRAVREQIRRGADVIKITATGGVLSNTATGQGQQFFDDELEAIVATARSMGRYVTAHAHGKDGIEAALRAGVASIEHGTYLDDETIALFRENDAYLVPTVIAGVTVAEMAETADWMTPPQREKSRTVGPLMLDMLRRAHEGGVKIAFGTDSGVSAHGDNAREFELMVEAGMTPEEAIAAATISAADHLEMAGEIGRLAPGFYADLIAVDGDPLENVSELRDVDFVMKGGEIYKDETE